MSDNMAAVSNDATHKCTYAAGPLGEDIIRVWKCKCGAVYEELVLLP